MKKKKRYALTVLDDARAATRVAARRFQRAPTAGATHALRVALRRERFLLGAYDDLVAGAGAARRRLGGIARALARAREPGVLARLTGARDAAWHRALRRAEKRATASAARRLPDVAAVDTGHPGIDRAKRRDAPASYERWAARRMEKRAKRSLRRLRHAAEPDDPALHQARKDLRKVRYLGETFAHGDRAARAAHDLQDRLGVLHDWAALRDRAHGKSMSTEALADRVLRALFTRSHRPLERDVRRLRKALKRLRRHV